AHRLLRLVRDALGGLLDRRLGGLGAVGTVLGVLLGGVVVVAVAANLRVVLLPLRDRAAPLVHRLVPVGAGRVGGGDAPVHARSGGATTSGAGVTGGDVRGPIDVRVDLRVGNLSARVAHFERCGLVLLRQGHRPVHSVGAGFAVVQ